MNLTALKTAAASAVADVRTLEQTEGASVGMMLAERVVNGHAVVCVVADPLIGLDYIGGEMNIRSENTVRALVDEMGLTPVVVRPRVIRYFLSEYEAAKKRLPRRTERVEPSQLANGKALKNASTNTVGHCRQHAGIA